MPSQFCLLLTRLVLIRPDLVVSPACEECRVVFLRARKQTACAAVDVSVAASLVVEMVSGEVGVNIQPFSWERNMKHRDLTSLLAEGREVLPCFEPW